MACAGDNPLGMPFCGHCGARDEVERPLPEDLWGCRNCGAPNGQVMVFCGRCGTGRGEERPEDLRLVTALFADISGFTTLADTLDAEDLHAVINPLIAGLAGIAERYGGFIAKYAGDALLCLFGAPVAHEDDAQRALLAANEMQGSLPALLATLGTAAEGLTIHVGVNTGKVVAGAVGSTAQADYSVLGDSVILAQRLESVCPSGQTYVGETTYELTNDEFDFEDVGELQLKGKLTVVRAFRLIGRRRSGTDASRPLVGRETELGVLLDAISRSGVAVVSGEPGVGKSRLLAEARLRATGSGSWWLSMRCLSYGASLPYWPFVDLLRQTLGLRIEDSVDEVLQRLSSTLPPSLVPGASRLLGRPVDELEPEAARRQVHDALAGMLAFLSSGRPITLAVEDAHWIDSASAEALAELIRTPTVPLSVVLNTRPEGLEACQALASAMSVHVEVELGPLEPSAVPLLASSALGHQVTGALVDLLVTRTQGNPLFIEELALSLHEESALVSTSAGLDLRPGFDVDAVPQTVERVFNARVDSLPLPALAVLSIAAVVGRVVRLSLLTEVASANGADLDHLDELVGSGLLDRVVEQDEPAVTFHHALLQDVVYGRLLKKQRRALHRTVADAGKALYGDGDETVDLLARHLYLARAGEEALDALLRAGRRAVRLYANAAAAEHIGRAVEVLEHELPGDPRLVDALLELGTVQDVRGAYEEALALFDRTRQLDEKRVPAWSGAAMALRRLGRYAEALALLDERPPPTPVPLQLERARNLFDSGSTAAALEAARAALAAATTRSDEADALLELSILESNHGQFEPAREHGLRALDLLQRQEDLRGQAVALRVLGDAEYNCALYDDSAAHLQRAIELADRSGDITEVASGLVNLARVHSALGNHQEAERATTSAAQLFERLGHGAGRAICYGNLADMVLSRGSIDESREWAQRSLEVCQQIGHVRQAAVSTLTLAEIAVAAVQPEVALDLLAEARATFVELGVTDLIQYCDDVVLEAQLLLAGAVS